MSKALEEDTVDTILSNTETGKWQNEGTHSVLDLTFPSNVTIHQVKIEWDPAPDHCQIKVSKFESTFWNLEDLNSIYSEDQTGDLDQAINLQDISHM